MPTSFREVFVIFALIGIFVFATISFVVVTQKDNDVENTILEDGIIKRTYHSINLSLISLEVNASTQKGSFESENPERGFGSLIIFSIVGVGKTFTSMVFGIYNIIIVLPASILNISPIITGVFTTILIVSLILLIWRVYRVGG